MGCSFCCSDKTDFKEPSVCLSTFRFRDQVERENDKICNLVNVNSNIPVQFSSRLTTPRTLFEEKISLYRKLDNEEAKSIDMGFFICYDDFSSVDLSKKYKGVHSAPESFFELQNKSLYKGEFDINGLPHGRGIEIRSNGSKYIGYFYHGNIQGQGRLINSEGILYQGEFETIEASTKCGENAVLNGLGKEVWPNGIKYEGEFLMGKKKGKGILFMEGCKYIGNFKNNEIHGEGTMIWENRKKYQGNWKKGQMHGFGTFSWPDGKVYQGEYKKGEKSGNGLMKWPNGKKYQGSWEHGKQHGEGILTFFDQSKDCFRSCRTKWNQGTRTN